MATVRAQPATTPTTVRAEVQKELSGSQWCARFKGSKDVSTLRPSFQLPVGDFVAAIEGAGATVKVNATFRPKERAYLMEWCWSIARGKVEADKVPAKDGVNINWVHSTREKSVAAARAMVESYEMAGLNVKPAGESSLHCIGEAIDMNISWSGSLKICNKDGSEETITSTPRDGMNAELAKVGATYGVIKFYGGSKDRPHWSTTGK